MRLPERILLAFALVLGPTSAAVGQATPTRVPAVRFLSTSVPLMASYRHLPPRAVSGVADSLHLPRTHWQTGLVVGGTLGALLGIAAGAGVCHDDGVPKQSCLGPALGGGLVMSLIGGTLGALIGGQVRERAGP